MVRGSLPSSAFEPDFLSRFSSELVLIPLAGRLLGLEDLASSVRVGHGTNSDFRVSIRRVEIQREFDGYVLATYEEWQRNAIASTPPDNGRIVSVLFEKGDSLRWAHIHETWLPEDVTRAGPFDF